MSAFVQQPVVNSFQLNIGSGEDTCVVSDDIYAVFDGHGGNIVSETLSKKIVEILKPKLSSIDISNNDEISDAVITAFREVDEYVLSKIQFNIRCGSTCSLVIKLDNKLVMVNLGDSSIILFVNGEKSYEMPQHLYSNPEEKARLDSLVESGEVYINHGYTPKVIGSEEITMVISNYIGLQSTREQIVPTKNFGHLSWKQEGIMDVVPYIHIVDILEGNSYECIIATDGVMDMLINTDELMQFLKSSNQSKEMVEFAASRWQQEWLYKIKGYDDMPGQRMPSSDDMTAIYIQF